MPNGPSASRASQSQQLRRKIHLVRAKLDAATSALWHHPRLTEIYPEYLFKNHSVVRSSVPLMEAALICAQTKFASDPVAIRTATYLSKHIPEEKGHDDWLLEDMKHLGIDTSEVVKRMPLPSAAALVGSQYYWIHHFHPVCLLGYIAVLEGTPPTAEYFDPVVVRSNLPKAAFSSLYRHARLDPQHRSDLDKVVDELPLKPEHSEMLGISAFQTVHLLTRVIEELVEWLPTRVTAASA